MRLRELTNYWRYRRIVRNPWQAATARRIPKPGTLVPMELRPRGRVFIRGGTADVRVFKDVFLKDTYGVVGPETLECVVDIGGHIGLFAIHASRFAGRVISVEPMPANTELFRRNVAEAGRENIELVECAVAGKAGTLEMFVSGNPAGHSAVRSLADDAGVSRTVRACTLAQLFEKRQVTRCSLLKMDCEGAEYEILHGTGPDTLASIDRLSLEYHDVGVQNPGHTAQGLVQLLSRAGFRVRCSPSRHRPRLGRLLAERG